MADDKDRLGDKLRDVEAAREDLWAKKLDEELLAKLRQKQSSTVECPRCKKMMTAQAKGGVAVLVCPDGHGAWVEGDAMKALFEARK
jgi:hypothetical protein